MFQQKDRKWLPQTDRPHTPSRRYPYQDVTTERQTTNPTDACKAMSMSRCFNRTTESSCHRPTDPTDTFKKVSISRCYNRMTDHRRTPRAPRRGVACLDAATEQQTPQTPSRICPCPDAPIERHGRLERDFPCQYMLSQNDRPHECLKN